MTMENLIELSLLLFISALVVTISVQHIRNNALQEDVKDYQQQIDQLHADSIKANYEATQARIIADREITASKMKAAQIMREKVSHECSKAIGWAIIEARKI